MKTQNLLDVFFNFSNTEIEEINSHNFFIYRIFSFDRFIDLIKDKEISFAKPNLWDDKYENPLSKELVDNKTGGKFKIPSLSENLYGQCWSTLHESDAIWRIYSTDKKGVLVRVEISSLFEHLSSCMKIHQLQKIFFGKVFYKTEEQIKSQLENPKFIKDMAKNNYIPSLFYKRDSFKHEEEIRVIFLDKISNDDKPKFRKLDIEANNLFSEITLDPRLENTDFDRQKYIIESCGYKGKIKKSTLYNQPELDIKVDDMMNL